MFGWLVLKTVSSFFASILSFATLSSASLPPTSPLVLPTSDPQQVALGQFHDIEEQLATLKVEAQYARILKRGSQGDDVKQLQKDLNTLVPSFPQSYISGLFGPSTEKAIKQFQTDHRVSVTGVFDAQTREMFSKLIASGSFTAGNTQLSSLEDFLNTTSCGTPTPTPDSSQTAVDTTTPNPDDTISVNDLPSACTDAGFILPVACTDAGYILPQDCPTIPDVPFPMFSPWPTMPIPTATLSPTPMANITPTATVSPRVSGTPTATPVRTPTPSPSTVATPSPTKTPTPSPTPIKTPTPTAVPTATATPVRTPTPTSVPTPTATAIPTAVKTPTPVPTATPKI